MFEEGVNLPVFYCFYFVKEILMDALEEYSREERDPSLEVEEDISILEDREKHWKGVVKYNIEEKLKRHVLRWKVYIKEKEELIKRHFLVEVPHLKEGNIVWCCVDDNII